jgi:hypothetical protein
MIINLRDHIPPKARTIARGLFVDEGQYRPDVEQSENCNCLI